MVTYWFGVGPLFMPLFFVYSFDVWMHVYAGSHSLDITLGRSAQWLFSYTADVDE